MGYIFGGTPGTYDVTLDFGQRQHARRRNVLRTGTAGETMALPGQQLFNGRTFRAPPACVWATTGAKR